MPNDGHLIIPDRLRVQLGDGTIQEMPLDEYLKGVVPTEMGLAKPVEALKAQAIAARSFGVVTRRHASEGFDVCITPHCQVWKPQNRYPDADRAVDGTAGRVIAHQSKIVGTHFFAHCDGHTRNSEAVWSARVDYLRSVPCICGYPQLYGHGVGMCQRGAAAMAREGATAQEILKHYYTGIEIVTATAVPRHEMRQSIILGQVKDGQGRPRGGLRLRLTGSEGPITKGTTADGRFWFSRLPAGQWDLTVKGKPVRYPGLVTDGRNTLDLKVVVPDATPRVMLTTPLAYPRQLVGTLGYDGVPVTVVDPGGQEKTVLSGSAPDFDPGGFALPLQRDGVYQVRFLDQSFALEVGSGGLWAQFLTEDRG